MGRRSDGYLMDTPAIPSPMEVGQANAKVLFVIVFVLIAIWFVAWLWARHPVVFICCLVVVAFGTAENVTRALATPPVKHEHSRSLGPQVGATPSSWARRDIPPRYLAIYRAKSTQRQCPGLSWTVLAGIGKVESDHGRTSLPGVRSRQNFAGAAGPMQIGNGAGKAGNS